MRPDSFIGQLLSALARTNQTTPNASVIVRVEKIDRPASQILTAIARSTPAFSASISPLMLRPKAPVRTDAAHKVSAASASGEDILDSAVSEPWQSRNGSYRQALMVGLAAFAIPVILAAFVLVRTALNPGYYTPTPLAPAVSPSPKPTNVFGGEATQKQLNQALLPANKFSSDATAASTGIDLSSVDALCGPLPTGAQLTAYEEAQDSQGDIFQEVIIEWDGPRAAISLFNTDRAALQPTGSCSLSSTEPEWTFTGTYPGVVPPECGGQYLGSLITTQSPPLFGSDNSVQCGRFTISLIILSSPGSTAKFEDRNSYLYSATARMQQVLARP